MKIVVLKSLLLVSILFATSCQSEIEEFQLDEVELKTEQQNRKGQTSEGRVPD